jgi:hypothetical protein
MSCLFVSIGTGIGKSAPQVRREIVDYITRDENGENMLEKNGENITAWVKNVSISEDMDEEEYITRMGKNSTWGGGLEIEAASQLYEIEIVVRHRNFVQKFGEGMGYEQVLILGYTGSHYTFQDLQDV